MRVTLDLTSLRAESQRQIQKLSRVKQTMQQVLSRAAEQERQQHPFDNYSGHLEASIRAETVREDADAIQVDLVLGSDADADAKKTNPSSSYAHTVQAAGRSTISKQANAAEAELTVTFNA